jgi:hypothetical protein
MTKKQIYILLTAVTLATAVLFQSVFLNDNSTSAKIPRDNRTEPKENDNLKYRELPPVTLSLPVPEEQSFEAGVQKKESGKLHPSRSETFQTLVSKARSGDGNAAFEAFVLVEQCTKFQESASRLKTVDLSFGYPIEKLSKEAEEKMANSGCRELPSWAIPKIDDLLEDAVRLKSGQAAVASLQRYKGDGRQYESIEQVRASPETREFYQNRIPAIEELAMNGSFSAVRALAEAYDPSSGLTEIDLVKAFIYETAFRKIRSQSGREPENESRARARQDSLARQFGQSALQNANLKVNELVNACCSNNRCCQ